SPPNHCSSTSDYFPTFINTALTVPYGPRSFYRYVPHPYLRSFPTRRSSDLRPIQRVSYDKRPAAGQRAAAQCSAGDARAGIEISRAALNDRTETHAVTAVDIYIPTAKAYCAGCYHHRIGFQGHRSATKIQRR